MKEKLINAFKELWSDVISEDNNSIDNAETEIEGVQNLQNYYSEMNRKWNDTWIEFLQNRDEYINADEETRDELEEVDIFSELFE